MNASQFEARLKEIVHKLQADFGHIELIASSGDIVEEVLLGILGRDASDSKARQALERLRRSMVDVNEMRVAAPGDVIDEVGPNFPGIEEKAQNLVSSLSYMYEHLETLDLTQIKAKPKREAYKWLSEVPGIDPYTLARVMLLCFGAHSVPINRPALGWLKERGLLEATQEVPEAQGVLERHVRSSDSMKVFGLLQRLAEKIPAAPAPKPKVEPPAKKKTKPEAAKAPARPEPPKAAEPPKQAKAVEARHAPRSPEARPAKKASKVAAKAAKSGRAGSKTKA
jgi:endonuclease III